MNQFKQILKMLWTVPITVFLLFLIVSLVPGIPPFPDFVDLGRNSTVDLEVNSPKQLFYIARSFSIEDDYDQLLPKLKFKVFDLSGKEISVYPDAHFFYGGKINGKTLSAGSVFHLPYDLKYPFKGRLESNINELDGVVWVKSEGSFARAFLLFSLVLAVSIYFNYWLIVKRRKMPVAAKFVGAADGARPL